MKKILLLFLSTLLFTFVHAQYLRGTFNSWSTDDIMTEYFSYYSVTIEAVTEITDGEFKVDQTGDWSLQWGYATDSYNPVVNTSEGQMRGSNSGDSPGNFVKTLSAGKFYTFRLEGTDTWWNRKFVIMETDAAPAGIVNVSDNSSTAGTGNVTVSVETTAGLSSQETVYIRYTGDSWASSDIIACTGSGTTYMCEIPGMIAGTEVEYYAFTSAMVLSFVSTYPDFSTLNANNNAGANYSYTVTSMDVYAVASVLAELEENTLNNAEINIEIFNDVFADAVIDPANIILNNAPAGLDVAGVSFVDPGNITVVLGFDGTDFVSDITDFSLTISADELTTSDPVTTNNLTIHAYQIKEDFTEAKIALWDGGTEDVFYNDTEFDGHDFGIMNSGSSLYLKSGQAFTWKITGGDITSATMNYRTYKQGETPGTFNQKNLDWNSETSSNDTTYQLWWNDSPDEINLDLLQGLTAGTYFVEVYFEVATASTTLYRNNGGLNYIAEFTWEDIAGLTATPSVELNSASLDGMEISLELSNETFADTDFDPANFVLNNAPSGLTVLSVVTSSESSATLTLSYAGGSILNQVDDFSVTVNAAELSGGVELTSNNMTIYADVITEGIYLSKISMWEGSGSDTWYNEADFNNHNFGTFNSSMSLYLKSGQVFSWKSTEGNIASAKMNYRIYKNGETPGAFVQQDLPFYSEWASGANTDQLWWNDSPDETNINLLDGIDPGTYFIEVYFEADNGNSVTYYSNNDGQNYIAEFSYTDNPVLIATPASAMTEENLDGMEITLDLHEDVFVDAVLDESNFGLNNVPAGVTIGMVSFVGTDQAVLTLAFDGTDFDADSVNFSISVNAAELFSGIGLTSNSMTITAIDESITIYTHLLTADNFERYQGDSPDLWINMEIGQTEWNGAQIGVGTVADDPSSFTWHNAEWYEDGEAPNKRVHSQIILPQEAGVLYYAGRVRNTEAGQWFYANSSEWTESNVLNAEYTITINTLPAPVTVEATMLDGTRINITWEKNPGFDNVMLVARATDAVTGNPVQGTAYSAGNIIDGAEVIYKGTATGFIHSGLQNNTTYNYKLYTLNNNYYSDGISASAATDDSEGCTFDLSLGEDINVCGGSSVLINPGLNISPYADTLTIIFNSSAYEDFADVTKVYMHSGVEINAGTTWDYVTGNWGEDDGLGLMTDMGSGMWMIKINPLDYYGYNPGSDLLGISIVFRNEDGTITAKNPETDEDFYIDMSVNPPVSSHNLVNPQLETGDITSILWSTGATTPSISVSNAGDVWLTAMNIYGCIGTDTVNVGLHSLPYVELGLDRTVCSDVEVILDAGEFESYIWNDNSDADTLVVAESGNYSVTVTDANGCTGFDVVNVNLVDYPVADFSYSVVSGTQVDFTDLSLNAVNYEWDFNNDNVTDNSDAGNVSYTYPALGQYSVKLMVSNDCSSDTEIKTIYVLSVDENQVPEFNIYPNPVSDILTIELTDAKEYSIVISDISGQTVLESQSGGSSSVRFDLGNFAPGMYNVRILTEGKTTNHKIIIK